MSSSSQASVPFHLRSTEDKERTWAHLEECMRQRSLKHYHANNKKHDCDICGGRYVTSKKGEHVKSNKHQKAIASVKDLI